MFDYAKTLVYLFVWNGVIEHQKTVGRIFGGIGIFVIGGALELIRRLFVFAWRGLVNQFWITIALEEYDDNYGES